MTSNCEAAEKTCLGAQDHTLESAHSLVKKLVRGCLAHFRVATVHHVQSITVEQCTCSKGSWCRCLPDLCCHVRPLHEMDEDICHEAAVQWCWPAMCARRPLIQQHLTRVQHCSVRLASMVKHFQRPRLLDILQGHPVTRLHKPTRCRVPPRPKDGASAMRRQQEYLGIAGVQKKCIRLETSEDALWVDGAPDRC